MMKTHPVFPFKITDWCCNHIWVHKQPLFLWQIALAIKIFGANILGLRLPSILMSVISVFLIRSIALNWLKSYSAAFIAALLFTFLNYQIELSIGHYSVDHNDTAFTFYITCAIWGILRYHKSSNKVKWAILVGVFSGLAVLNKWLVGLLPLGGFAYLLLLESNWNFYQLKWKHLITGITSAILIFAPWQLFIIYKYPTESAASFAHNRLHISETIGEHYGSIFFYFEWLNNHYSPVLIPFLLIGLILLLLSKDMNRKLTWPLLAMTIVVYAFFSIFVKTKMPAFTFPVYSIILSLIAYGVIRTYNLLLFKIKLNTGHYILKFIQVIGLCLLAIVALKPESAIKYRTEPDLIRKAKIHNTKIYRTLDPKYLDNYIILNCKSFEDVELMYWQNVDAYHWWPEKKDLDSLQNLGYKFACFKSHTNQQLPQYIFDNKDILIIDKELK